MELSVEQWIIAVLSILFSPGVFLFWLIVFLAVIERSSGITRLYVRILLIMFEWGKERIRIYEEALEKDEVGTLSEDNETLSNKDVEYLSRQVLIANRRSVAEMHQGFTLTDAMYFCNRGMQVIVDDEVTQRFDAAELPSWNLLTRTNTHYEFISVRLTFLWVGGRILRHLILFPIRLAMITVGCWSLIVGTAIIGYIPDGQLKRRCNYLLTVSCNRVISRAFSAVIRFHNRENRAKGGGICVANHTSPIDIIVLGCDNSYAMVGQSQGGFMGLMQRAMSRAEHHIWFQRSEVKDRLSVAQRLRDHIEDTNKLPILIFPEGTCINNTSIMMFKKGSFEVGGTIYPVAIKYDSRFADPFWNSSKQTLSRHLLNILTSWALVCDVWYLPPEDQQADETALEFTNRVKAEIARQGGLVDLDWDGELKRNKPKVSFLENQQREYSRRISAETEDQTSANNSTSK